jgi:hypothetical protein
MKEDTRKQVMDEVYRYIDDFENDDSQEPRILRSGFDREDDEEEQIIAGQKILDADAFKVAFCKLYNSETVTDLKGLADLISPIILPSIGTTAIFVFGVSIPLATAAPVIWYIVYKIWTRTGENYCQDKVNSDRSG